MSTPESVIKSEIVKLLESAGYYVIRNLQGGIQYRKNHPGISDLTVIKKGRVTWAEIKTPKGRHRDDQLVFKFAIEDAGGEYVTWASVDDCVRWMYEALPGPAKEVAAPAKGGGTLRPPAG